MPTHNEEIVWRQYQDKKTREAVEEFLRYNPTGRVIPIEYSYEDSQE